MQTVVTQEVSQSGAITSAGRVMVVRVQYTVMKMVMNMRMKMTDKEMLDWLEMQYVVVRIPQRYGSRECFSASPIEVEADWPSEPSNIRQLILLNARK